MGDRVASSGLVVHHGRDDTDEFEEEGIEGLSSVRLHVRRERVEGFDGES